MGKKTRQPDLVGPWSDDARLAMADGRTKLGKLVREVRREMIEHVGGNPSAAQMILIYSVTLKTVRLTLMAERILDHKRLDDDPAQFLAWSNSLRLDLAALGITRAAQAGPSLAKYIEGKAS